MGSSRVLKSKCFLPILLVLLALAGCGCVSNSCRRSLIPTFFLASCPKSSFPEGQRMVHEYGGFCPAGVSDDWFHKHVLGRPKGQISCWVCRGPLFLGLERQGGAEFS